jgi:hypothetical protein
MPKLRSIEIGCSPVDAQVAGAAGQVEHGATGGQCQTANRGTAPTHIEAECHHPVHEVVARGDGVEHVAHRLHLLLALR